MANKQDKKQPVASALSKKEKELAKLMEKHPEETMSQVENRYGKGREKNGSDGPYGIATGSNH